MTNIRKLLGGVSFVAVLLLNQPITRAQGLGDVVTGEASEAQGFGDFFKEEFPDCSSHLTTIPYTGDPKDDYMINTTVPTQSCTIPHSKIRDTFDASGHASLGGLLGVYGSSAVTGQFANDRISVTANDTLILHEPAGFTGAGIVIPVEVAYTLKLQGAGGKNSGFAEACFQWTGEHAPTCTPPLTTNGAPPPRTFKRDIFVQRTSLGFQLNFQLIGLGEVATLTGSRVSNSVSIGTPQFMLPDGWSSSWESGEP